nr:hypothetical protein [Tanacetum cinerariifolium]
MKILSIIKIFVDKQFGYGYLKEIVMRWENQKEYVFKEADFPKLHLNDIEAMYLLIVLKKRVEDVQLGVKSYQIKLNITRPQVRCADLDVKETYTILHKPRGVVYLDKNNDKYLIRGDELYKFGDGTLNKVRDILDSMLHNFELGYNNRDLPKKAWSKKRKTSMLKKIDATLLER